MASKEVADLTLAEDFTGVELHIVRGVTRDGGGAVTSHGNSRRLTLASLAAYIGIGKLLAANNLSDLASAPTARTNLGMLRLISFFFTGSAVTASEILAAYVAIDAFTIPANFAGSKAGVIVNPTASFAIDVARQVNGAGAFTTIGTITISAAGALTWATAAGAAIAIAAGDVIKFTGDGDGDATVQASITVKGTL